MYNHYKIIYFSSMHRPNITDNQKPKLILQQKPILKSTESQFPSVANKFIRLKSLIEPTKNCESKQQRKPRNRSNSFKKNTCIGIGSLESRKIGLKGKQNTQNAKIQKNLLKVVSKPSLKLIHGPDGIKSSKSQQSTLIGSECSGELQRRKIVQSDQIKQNSIKQDQKCFKTRESSQSLSKCHKKSATHSIQNFQFNAKGERNQSQTDNLFGNYDNSHLKQQPDIIFRKAKRNSIVPRSRKYSRVIADNSLSMNFNVFSLQIHGEESPKSGSIGKRKLIQQCIDDPDFEWKYRKYKEYAKNYTQYEITIKQKFTTLKFLTQNLELLKERIAPFKSIESLTQLVEILRPTLSQKEEYAHEIKMQMLEWKKKFFTNVHKIKESFNKNVEEKYETVFIRLSENENAAEKMLQLFDVMGKKQTVTFEKQDFQNLQNVLEPLLMNQNKQLTKQSFSKGRANCSWPDSTTSNSNGHIRLTFLTVLYVIFCINNRKLCYQMFYAFIMY